MTRQAGDGWAFTSAALTFGTVYLAAGALMPLMVVYRERWSLSAAAMTLTFAVFAPAFLAAILTLGSLSDRIGRRPVLIGALLMQIGSVVVFLVAPSIGWVIGARAMQGFATGAATPAFTAALVELAPSGRKSLGTMLGSVSLTGGLAAGSLLAGLLVQLTVHAKTVIFLALAVITAAGIGAVVRWREPLTRAPGVNGERGRRLVVPPAARAEFAAAVPVLAAVWMVSGLSGGIAPSLVRSVFGVNSGLLNGLSGFVAPAASAIVGIAVRRAEPRRVMVVGILTSVIGTAGIVVGVVTGPLATMIVGQAIAGVGFGASFTAALRLIMPLVKEHERAGLAAAIYLVSYTAFGVPMVLVGQATSRYGTGSTIVWFGVVAGVLALFGLRHNAK
jgi:MFS family permease